MLSALRLGALLMPVDDSLVRDTVLIIQHLKDNKQKFKVTRSVNWSVPRHNAQEVAHVL